MRQYGGGSLGWSQSVWSNPEEGRFLPVYDNTGYFLLRLLYELIDCPIQTWEAIKPQNEWQKYAYVSEQ